MRERTPDQDPAAGHLNPGEPLATAAIEALLQPVAAARYSRIEVLPQVGSTNDYLLAAAGHGAASGTICLAEAQTAGRGRRGRDWASPAGANLYFSWLWRLPRSSRELSGLSLAIGVALVRGLQAVGATGVGLKWPNDILAPCAGKDAGSLGKLGGILVECGHHPGTDRTQVVAGVGINCAMPPAAAAALDQPWVDLQSLLGPEQPSRNRLAAELLNQLVNIEDAFGENGAGLPALADDWHRFDLTRDRPVSIILANQTVAGIARGVDDAGALCIETSSGHRRFTAGDVSLRFAT